MGELVGLRLDALLEHLDLSFQKRGKMLVGACPVHGGRGMDAFNIYPDGYSVRGNWKCRSRSCHKEFKQTVVGLVWGVLSHRENNWQGPSDKKKPFNEVVKFLCDFVGQPLHTIKVDSLEVEKRAYAAQMEQSGFIPQKKLEGWLPEQIRKRIEVATPPNNYDAGILKKYDVGLWLPNGNARSAMVGRIAVPIFDEEYKRVVGITGRSPFVKCAKCDQFHDDKLSCPKEKRPEFAKWYNSPGFRKEAFLYNYWFAKTHIRDTGVVGLVEGPGDVWRAEEAGIHNMVGMFGCELNDPQQVILERSGASTIVLFPHNDEAGQHSREFVERQLGRSYRVCFYDLPAKDLGETSVQYITQNVVPFMGRLARKGKL